MKIPSSRFLACLALVLALADSARAIVYDSATRTLQAVAGNFTGVSDLKTTTALGAWSESVYAPYSEISGGAIASGNQTSDLGALSITMSGSQFAISSSNPFQSGTFSQLNTDFTLAVDTPYTSSLTTSGTNAYSSFFSFTAIGGSPSYSANSSGILPAGQYSLDLAFSANAPYGQSSSQNYNYSLALPEPASASLILIGAALFFTGLIRKRGLTRRSEGRT